ncbi:MAG: hypothetical protein IPP19_10070 [Verrucomicrobia bacterium]|nr:hypothetical protein [Verrucomicrobiota bacterium]
MVIFNGYTTTSTGPGPSTRRARPSPWQGPGFGIKALQPWYAYNLLEEITRPGGGISTEKAELYLWPPSGFSGTSDVMISLLETPLFTLNKASNIVLADFTAEGTRKNLISISGATATCCPI